jgi:hypothetical protein
MADRLKFSAEFITHTHTKKGCNQQITGMTNNYITKIVNEYIKMQRTKNILVGHPKELHSVIRNVSTMHTDDWQLVR